NVVRRGAHRDQDADQRRFGEVDVEIGADAVERLFEQLYPPLSQLGRVIFARGVDQAGDEAVEGVAPHEEAESLPRAQVQDTRHYPQQFRLSDLEQLVARVGLDDVEQRLAGVAAGLDAGAQDDVRRLSAQQRDLRRFGAVCGRSEQPQKTMLAADLALLVEAFDADVIEVAGAVYGRARIGLGDVKKSRQAGEGAHVRRQGSDARSFPFGLPQNSQPGVRQDAQRLFAFDPGQVVAAVAEEGEMILGEPSQKRLAFEHFVGGQGGTGGLDLTERLIDLRLHLLPIGHGAAHVPEHSRQIGGERGDLVRRDDPIDLDVHERLGADSFAGRGGYFFDLPVGAPARQHYRVDDQVKRQPMPVHLHRHRIDQEGHVVVDYLDHRVRRLPAVLFDRRVEDPQLRLARLALAREVPV